MIAATQFCNMRRFIPLLLGLIACSVFMPTPASTPEPTVTSVVVPTLLPTPEPGSDKNPLILALAPAAHPTSDFMDAGKALATQLQTLTGYKIITIAPASETDLLSTFAQGNVSIAALSPFAYLLAYQNGSAQAILASAREGKAFYGAQFIARPDNGFKPYFDPVKDENTLEAAEALMQFNDKKPCWSDAVSPSGYVIPLGFLNQAKVGVRLGAFVEGQPTVVRAVYNKDICDFGATYIDARQFPALETDYPNVTDKVAVIWRIPAIIPYDNISLASGLAPDMRRTIQRAFIDMMGTPESKSAIQKAYGLETLQAVDDGAYKDFIAYTDASGLDIQQLIK